MLTLVEYILSPIFAHFPREKNRLKGVYPESLVLLLFGGDFDISGLDF